MSPEVPQQLLLHVPQVVAVIPGLAPGIVAILPHLVLLLVASLTLIASPRVWWRVLTGCARHPAQTLIAAALAAVGIIAARAVLALIPPVAPGAAIGDAVHGYAVGDARAAAVHAGSTGPLTAPSARRLDLAGAGSDPAVIAADGTQLFVASGGRRIAAFDLQEERVAWAIDLPGELAATPVALRRQVDGKAEPGLIAPISLGDRGLLLLLRGGTASRVELPSAPRALCAVDDRIVVALDRELRAFSIAGPEAPCEVWRAPRPDARAIAIAADENGCVYLLDVEALRAGDLARGVLDSLAAVESPRGLSVAAGLAYVLEAPEGRARLRCVDPAAPRRDRWSARIDAPLSVRPVVAEFGVIVTTARGIELRDRFSGTLLDRVELAPAPATAAVATPVSCFALLENGAVARYSPGLGRVVWSVAPDRPADHPESSVSATPALLPPALLPPALLPVGRALLALYSGATHLLSERESSAELAWSHAHGSADRAGASRGAQAPLLGEILWRTPLPGAVACGPLPVPGGWLAACAHGAMVRLVHATHDGRTTVSGEFEGAPRGLVRHGERVLLALAGDGARGRVLALDAGRAALPVLWEVPLPGLGRRHVLAASEDSIVVALADSIRCLAAHDGGRRWESDVLRDVEAPLLAGEVVVAVGATEQGPAIVALGVPDGEVRWRRGAIGAKGAASLHEGALIVGVSAADGEGRVLSLSLDDGAAKWELRTQAPIQGPVALAHDAAVFNAGGNTHVLRLSGERVGAIACGESKDVIPAAAVAPGVVLVADGPRVRCLDTATLEPIWESALPAAVHALALDGERVLATAGPELVLLGAAE